MIQSNPFRRRGLRSTPQRYAVYRYLAEHPGHATAEEIYRGINQNDPRSSRATVYNAVHTLVRAGLVREIHVDGGPARFDANLEWHGHFLCERCGAIEDVEWIARPPLPRRSVLEGRRVRHCEVVMRGLCASCARNREEPNG